MLVAPAPPTPVTGALRDQIVADKLRGHADAKRTWTDSGMVEDICAELGGVRLPATMLVGDRDQVENAEVLRAAFAPILPQTRFAVLEGVEHLSPLEAPGAVADACRAMLRSVAAAQA